MQQQKVAMDVMQRQLGQLATEMNDLRNRGKEHLPSQPNVNPKGNVSAITLRSGRKLSMPYPTIHQNEEEMSETEDQIDSVVQKLN